MLPNEDPRDFEGKRLFGLTGTSMRVLVTGGAGYIGSHTAKALAAAGYEPVVFDNLSTGHRSAVKWGPLIEGDLADVEHIRRTLRDYRCQAVIHFAASADVGESVAAPRKYFRNNVVNSLNLLDAMLDCEIGHIVFSSSCATYGIVGSVPVTEEQPQVPINPYGASKLFVEQVLKSYGDVYGLKWVTLRYFNAAGADPDGEIGSKLDPEIRLVPIVIQAALGQRPAVQIFGTNYETPDGTCIRDYVHVTDVAGAHISALRHLANDGASVALNLGTGCGFSVREVIDAVQRFSGKTVAVTETRRREGDAPAVIADPSRAKAILGWRPRHSSLDEIVQTAWHWQSGELSQA
jgi:UDP-arabinose 4-epimerase